MPSFDGSDTRDISYVDGITVNQKEQNQVWGAQEYLRTHDSRVFYNANVNPQAEANYYHVMHQLNTNVD